ncbi:MAG: hypothetical protein FWB84_07215 [Candidatus Bathyarchaeota archaeon]|uniref:hypothetical protein n=1 Tax=Candidatus Bathycorpusculum sp. TaxID=2994959 RepID=UPI00282A5344|nr:hypothetical protein [Candidatus Termiticorpusculum sp.]MCL2257083.1 hypothetical protein [Candidatus Termiticorpusculum sp.]MCL2292772.1 hypothetical protein [Candidatus Termiticorpusculum sp.]
MLDAIVSLIDIEWNQFIPSILATFVGVLAALLLQRFYEWWKETNEAKEIKKRARAELIRIKDELTDIAHNEELLMLKPIKTPVYHNVINLTKRANCF